MDGFERRKEQSKERIVKAATELFSRYGIDKISISDVARQANVSHVTIYNLFGSKDGLVETCLKSIMPTVVDKMRDIIKTDKPYLEKMENIFQYFVQVSEASQGLGEIDVANYPQFEELQTSYIDSVYDVLLEFIREGQKQNYLDKDLSEGAIKAFIEIFIRGINSNPELHARAHHDPKLFHDLLHLMLFGLGRVENITRIKKIKF